MKNRLVLWSGLPALVLTLAICSTIGSVELGTDLVFESVMAKALGWPEVLTKTQALILYGLRLPRLFLAAVAGGGLALSGLVLQGLFRNPLADPYILGISSGASLGAALAIATGLGAGLFGSLATSLVAFVFSLAVLALVMGVGRVGKVLRPARVLLAGIAIGQIASAGLSFLMVFHAEQLDRIVYWTLGSLAGKSVNQVAFVALVVFLGNLVFMSKSKEMDLMLLGEDTAQTMGVAVEATKRLLLLTASLVTATIVALTGAIGFVGLVVPHILRLIIGPGHRDLVPASGLWGGVFLCWADTLARTIFSPLELPIGVVTALVGAPFFVALLRRSRMGDSL